MQDSYFKEREKKTVRVILWLVLANYISTFILFLLAFEWEAAYITITAYILTFNSILFVLSTLISIILFKKHYKKSKYLTFITGLLMMLQVCIIYGNNGAGNIICMLWIIGCFLLLDEKERIMRRVMVSAFTVVWIIAELVTKFFINDIHLFVFNKDIDFFHANYGNLYLINLGLSIVTFLVLLFVYVMRSRELEVALVKANTRIDGLLRNVFPKTIVEKLYSLSGDTRISDKVADVAILFADLTNFTKSTQDIPPEKLLDELNEIYNRIDSLAEKHLVEKIKTIGDGYLAICGAPDYVEDNVLHVVEFARDIIQYIEEHRKTSVIPDLHIRIGIDVGTIITGVIGSSRQIYDIWGTPVNKASRLESGGVPGKIQVSETVYQQVSRLYPWEKRIVELKGIGRETVYTI